MKHRILITLTLLVGLLGFAGAPASATTAPAPVATSAQQAGGLRMTMYVWKPAPHNNPSACFWRGQEGRWRKVQTSVGPAWLGECRVLKSPFILTYLA